MIVWFWTTLPTGHIILFFRLHQFGSTWPKSMKSVNNGEMLQEYLLGFLWKQDKGDVKLRSVIVAFALCYVAILFYSQLLGCVQ